MKILLKAILVCILFILYAQNNFGQCQLPCLNDMGPLASYLNFVPEASTKAMGGGGLAGKPGTASVSLNPSNLMFSESRFGFSESISRRYVNLGLKDVYFSNFNGYVMLNDKNLISTNFRYYHLGSIQFVDDGSLYSGKPKEFSFTITYSRRLSKSFSASLGLKYINSNLDTKFSIQGNLIQPLSTIAGDFSLTYQKSIRKSVFRSALAISNIGPKGAYLVNLPSQNYLSTNLGFGMGVTIKFNEDHNLSVNFDLNRLLTPSPSTIDVEGEPGVFDYLEKNILQGMLSSFGDSPDGLQGDFMENKYSLGIEYGVKSFRIRQGLFLANQQNGHIPYASLGAGFNVKGVGIDLAFSLNLVDYRTPSTPFMLTLSYNFTPIKENPAVEQS